MFNGADVLSLPHGDLPLPAFLPDATRGVVRSIDSADLERCGVSALVMNTFHLMQHPGSTTIKALGGLHRMSGWPHPIMSDSGGFQIYSLIRQNAKYGRLNDSGAIFTPDGSARKFNLTPEKSIQLQMSYGSDILVCLDDCTHASDTLDEQKKSVKRTVDWARRSKAEFRRLCDQKKWGDTQRPLLFAVIQGGSSPDLRRECAESLLEIGFDGFGYGGWPLDSENHLLVDMLGLTRELVPLHLPLHALGVGHPANVVECARLGYPMFDSAMPTRDARNARLYTFTTDDPRDIGQPGAKWFEYVYVGDDRHIKDSEPPSTRCDCACCAHYSLGYLHHLFKINDTLFMRLATIHNLRFMMQLTERLREIAHG
ncbi:MAG: queuine tRNA-ribosyltransferase family protein [Chloroflexi bacterium]|nr:queuine tRNA-ribosyltransferase family protein [Chloroflexota bacterium]